MRDPPPGGYDVDVTLERTPVAEDELALVFLGQNAFLVKTPRGTRIALDPYLSRTPRYTYVHPVPPLRPEDVRVDYVFCTHDHRDHTDPDTLPAIAAHAPATRFLGPREAHAHFLVMGIAPRRTRRLDAATPCRLSDFTVTPLYSVPPDEAGTTHFGYLFDFGFATLYVMGDSSPGVAGAPHTVLDAVARYRPDIAILPIIGDFPGRRPEDAVRFARLLHPRIVVPCHYGCFADRTIDPAEFVALCADVAGVHPVVIPYAGLYRFSSPRR